MATEGRALLDRSMSEHAWQLTVIAAARVNGWEVHWTPDWVWAVIAAHVRDNSRRAGSREWAGNGWPDLVLWHPVRGKTLYVECKTTLGRVSPAQRQRITTLYWAGNDVRVWRPGYWADEVEPCLVGAERGKGPGKYPGEAEVHGIALNYHRTGREDQP